MEDAVKQLCKDLRAHGVNNGASLGMHMGICDMAADMLEKLSADLESDERKYARDAFDLLVAEGVKLEADRDAWKRRAEAAERDMGCMIPCKVCKHVPAGEAPECQTCAASILNDWRRSNYAWRGPCAENGGSGVYVG